MGEKIGAEVWLDRVPLKYDGLSYTEIWISEAQERMVISVPPEKVEELTALCASEGVEATVIGQFVPTGRLVLKYRGQEVANLAMEFLHDGRPPVVREAVWEGEKGRKGEGEKGSREQGQVSTEYSVLSTLLARQDRHHVSPAPFLSAPCSPTLRLHGPCSDFTPALLSHPRLAERLQQGMDHPPVRPRGAGAAA